MVQLHNDNTSTDVGDDVNPDTGNSLSDVFAAAILALTAAEIAYKKRRK